MNRNGALAGIIVGGVTVVVYKQIDTIGLYEIVPGVILATIAIVVATLLSPPPSSTMEATFDEVANRY